MEPMDKSVGNIKEIVGRFPRRSAFVNRGHLFPAFDQRNWISTNEGISCDSLTAFNALEQKRTRASVAQTEVRGDRGEHIRKQSLAHWNDVIRSCELFEFFEVHNKAQSPSWCSKKGFSYYQEIVVRPIFSHQARVPGHGTIRTSARSLLKLQYSWWSLSYRMEKDTKML